MDVRLLELAARQHDLVASWQLRALGWSAKHTEQHARRHHWRRLHRGVYVLTQGTLTRHQRWLAATLTTPDSYLSHGSACAHYGIRRFDRGYETVTRPGDGGRRRIGSLLVFRSTTLAGATTISDGIPITTAERTLVDLAPHLNERQAGRAFREALRLKVTTATGIAAALASQQSARGTSQLRELTRRYGHLPYARTRSNPEARALEVLHDAGAPPPLVNVRIAGEEADLAWPKPRVIVEIDGPQYHRFRDEDARKEQRWRSAGYDVRRIASDLVYDRPDLLLALAPAA
jgi:hypothetical protein